MRRVCVLSILLGFGLSLVPSLSVDISPISEKLICCLHGHATEVGDQVSTVSVASNVALRAFAGVLASKREHITAMAAPISTDVRQRFEAMRNTVINLLFVTFLQLEYVCQNLFLT